MWTLPSSEKELKELLAKEKQRGYSLGHAAGRKKLDSDILQCAKLAQRADFIDAAFLSIFPAILQTSWNTTDADGNVMKETMESKTKVAWRFARESWNQRGY